MPQFRYRAVTHAGEILTGEVEAPSRAEVIRRIEYLGHLTIEAEIASTGVLSGVRLFGDKQPGSRDVSMLLRQLALLLGAGLTLADALATLSDDANAAVAGFARELRGAISSGESFAQALERHAALVEPGYVAMVRAGEASGRLEGVLRAIVEDRARRETLSEKINAAIRYPIFLVASAIIILLFFLIYVVPQFEPVFKDLGGRLNAGAAIVVACSAWLNLNLDLFLGTCLALTLGAWLVLSQRAWRVRILAACAALPGIAGLVEDRRAAKILATLGLLLENGVPLPVTLKILRDVVTDPRCVEAVDRVNEQVRGGRRLADALAETDLLPALAVRMLRIGDETGDAAGIVRHASEFYAHKLGIGLDRLMGAIGPVAIIAVSLIIGTLIISIMSALLSITELAR